MNGISAGEEATPKKLWLVFIVCGPDKFCTTLYMVYWVFLALRK